jgi:hypothetical protein
MVERAHMTYTEQAVHLDGPDTVEGREEGTRGLLDAIADYLANREKP